MRRVRGERRLKAKDITKLGPGWHDDGGGLRLEVEAGGRRHWALRYTIAGKRRSKGLGSFPLVSLEDAREEADDIRRAARKGQDIATTRSVTFRHAFDTVFELRRRKLSNAKHVWQWQASMEATPSPCWATGRSRASRIATSWASCSPSGTRRPRPRSACCSVWSSSSGRRSFAASARKPAPASALPRNWASGTAMSSTTGRCPTPRCRPSCRCCAHATRSPSPSSPSSG